MSDTTNHSAAIAPTRSGVALRVKVVPNASRSRVVGMLGDRLKVQVAAPAEAGKANKAVCALLADALGVKAGDVVVAAGASQPHKTVTVTGLTRDEAARRLG